MKRGKRRDAKIELISPTMKSDELFSAFWLHPNRSVKRKETNP